MFAHTQNRKQWLFKWVEKFVCPRGEWRTSVPLFKLRVRHIVDVGTIPSSTKQPYLGQTSSTYAQSLHEQFTGLKFLKWNGKETSFLYAGYFTFWMVSKWTGQYISKVSSGNKILEESFPLGNSGLPFSPAMEIFCRNLLFHMFLGFFYGWFFFFLTDTGLQQIIFSESYVCLALADITQLLLTYLHFILKSTSTVALLIQSF